MSENEFTPQEKAARVAFQMALGEGFTVREVADDFGMTWRGAYRMITGISRVVPIAQDDGGRWRHFCNMTGL